MTPLRPWILSLLLAAAAAGLILPAAAPAYACTCLQRSPREYVEGADLVLTGKVLRLTGGEADPDAIVLVLRYLKGDGPSQIAVDDPPDQASCGIFDADSLGETYLLFLRGQEEPFRTDLCAGSLRLAGERADQRFFQEIVALTGSGRPPERSGLPVPAPLVPLAAVAGAAALAIASVFLLRRRIIGRG